MRPLYRIVWIGSRLVFGTYFRWRVFHSERVPGQGSVILAANHASFLDPPLIGAGLERDIHYLARESLFSVPVLGAALRRLNCVPVDGQGGGGAGLKSIFDRLTHGNAILLFPEGTRTHDGVMQPARAGIGLVVVKSRAPVVPVRVFGTYQALGRHMRWPVPCPVAIKYGDPMFFERLRGEAQSCSKARLKVIYQEVADEIRGVLERLEPCWDRTTFP